MTLSAMLVLAITRLLVFPCVAASRLLSVQGWGHRERRALQLPDRWHWDASPLTAAPVPDVRASERARRHEASNCPKYGCGATLLAMPRGRQRMTAGPPGNLPGEKETGSVAIVNDPWSSDLAQSLGVVRR